MLNITWLSAFWKEIQDRINISEESLEQKYLGIALDICKRHNSDSSFLDFIDELSETFERLSEKDKNSNQRNRVRFWSALGSSNLALKIIEIDARLVKNWKPQKGARPSQKISGDRSEIIISVFSGARLISREQVGKKARMVNELFVSFMDSVVNKNYAIAISNMKSMYTASLSSDGYMHQSVQRYIGGRIKKAHKIFLNSIAKRVPPDEKSNMIIESLGKFKYDSGTAKKYNASMSDLEFGGNALLQKLVEKRMFSDVLGLVKSGISLKIDNNDFVRNVEEMHCEKSDIEILIDRQFSVAYYQTDMILKEEICTEIERRRLSICVDIKPEKSKQLAL